MINRFNRGYIVLYTSDGTFFERVRYISIQHRKNIIADWENLYKISKKKCPVVIIPDEIEAEPCMGKIICWYKHQFAEMLPYNSSEERQNIINLWTCKYKKIVIDIIPTINDNEENKRKKNSRKRTNTSHAAIHTATRTEQRKVNY